VRAARRSSARSRGRANRPIRRRKARSTARSSTGTHATRRVTRACWDSTAACSSSALGRAGHRGDAGGRRTDDRASGERAPGRDQRRARRQPQRDGSELDPAAELRPIGGRDAADRRHRLADRYVCVHGHFYQPPRENPWLEVVEQQDSAYPFHDWNERITAECYGPNTAARILDERRPHHPAGQQLRPHQLQRRSDPARVDETARAPRYAASSRPTAQQPRALRRPRLGDGAGLQPRDHAAGQRPRPRTQVRWGIRDFEHRFGRAPEGMWLAETAVDDATLELLAEHGIRFTVLSPYQARARPPDRAADGWTDVSGGRVDPDHALPVPLPSAARSRCSSTTARSRRRSPSRAC
jgi:hypothetical protein